MTDVLVKKIKNDIIEGVLKPGERLLPLRELALKYEVSRSVINGVISSLSALGYVSVTDRHFVVVNDFMSQGSTDVLLDVLESGNRRLQLRTLKDSLRYRKLIMLESIRMIIQNPHADLKGLIDAIEKQKAWMAAPDNDIDLIMKLDLAFFHGIIDAGDNVVIKLIHRNFNEMSSRMIRFYYRSYNLAHQHFKTYGEIVKAILDHDEKKAVAIMEQVMDLGATYVLRLMN